MKNETVVVPFTSAQCEHRGCKACVYTSKKNETVVVPFTSAQCEHRGCKACVYTSKRFPEE